MGMYLGIFRAWENLQIISLWMGEAMMFVLLYQMNAATKSTSNNAGFHLDAFTVYEYV
jgi:hypothetical protein